MQDPLLRLHCIPLSMLGGVLSSMLLQRYDLLGFRYIIELGKSPEHGGDCHDPEKHPGLAMTRNYQFLSL
jgi:hypothetical protein